MLYIVFGWVQSCHAVILTINNLNFTFGIKFEKQLITLSVTATYNHLGVTKRLYMHLKEKRDYTFLFVTQVLFNLLHLAISLRRS